MSTTADHLVDDRDAPATGRTAGPRSRRRAARKVPPDAQAPAESTFTTLRRGLALSPRLRTGLAGTLDLAILAMLGRVVVPVAVQQGIDRRLRARGGPELRVIAVIASLTVLVLAATTACSYLMMRRLFTVTET